jgi:hypothetical protein
MATANSFDMQLIAADSNLKTRVQALLNAFLVGTVFPESCSDTGSVTPQRHLARKAYASQVLNNYSAYATMFEWAAASNQTLANDVVTTNGGNFTSSTTQATVAAAVTTATPTTTGATDTDINNALAASFNLLANA